MSHTVHDSVIILSDRYLDQFFVLLALPLPDEEAVHELRVLIKLLPRLARLYKPDAPREALAGINGTLRDVARVFAAQRDAHVLVETLNQVANASDRAVATQLREISREVQAQTQAVKLELAPASLQEDLEWVRSQWHDLQRDDKDFLVAALVRSYRRCRKAGSGVLRRREGEELHEWRKQVKYMYYQLSVLDVSDGWLVRQQ